MATEPDDPGASASEAPELRAPAASGLQGDDARSSAACSSTAPADAPVAPQLGPAKAGEDSAARPPAAAMWALAGSTLRSAPSEASEADERQVHAYEKRLQARVHKLSAIRAQRMAHDLEADEADSCCLRSVPRLPNRGSRGVPKSVDRRAALAAVGMPPPRPAPGEGWGLLGWVSFLWSRSKCCSIRDAEDV
mmetsp:Transcript_109134/g.308558  ORF Transcript_109134/g.308558 Transcript_109134/m.308558 type:complete len:193 (-) Transcript_109134:69-647(-)